MRQRPVRRRRFVGLWPLLLSAAVLAGGCVLGPSPDLPGAMSDEGYVPGAGGGLGSPGTGGAGPCLSLQVPAETWCEEDDLWTRNPSCQGDPWTVKPCPNGCVEVGDPAEASCQGDAAGGAGGFGGQSAESP